MINQGIINASAVAAATVASKVNPQPQGTQTAGVKFHSTDASNGARVILAWFLTILLLALATRTRVGYVVAYYALILGIVIVLLSSYQQVTGLLSLVQSPVGPASQGQSGS